jgi:hypothetical protein
MAQKDTVNFVKQGTIILRHPGKLTAKLCLMIAHRCIAFGLLSLTGGLLFAACLPDAKGDYDKFVTVTEPQREKPGGGVSDAAVDASVVAIDANYLAVCYSALMTGSMGRTLRFYTQVKVDPMGAGGKAKLVLYPMRADARKFERGMATNSPLTYDNVTVGEDTRFTGILPMVAIEGAANPLSGKDITIDNVKLTGLLYAKDTFCSGFSGAITMPIQQEFDAICRYFALKEGDEFSFQNDDEAALPNAFLTIPAVRAARFASTDFKTCPPAN